MWFVGFGIFINLFSHELQTHDNRSTFYFYSAFENKLQTTEGLYMSTHAATPIGNYFTTTPTLVK